MRRFLFGMAIASITVAAPMTALAGDREIADAIVSNLKQKQANGSLKGFDIDLSVEGGKVTFTGKVANEQQMSSVLAAAKSTAGVSEVVNKVQVGGKTMPKPVSLKEVAKSIQNAVQPASSSEPSDDTGYTPAPMEPPSLLGEKAVSPRDAAITERIISKLSSDKSSGVLRHFELDVSTVEGEVWARGHVLNAQQKQHVLQTIQHTSGVRKVVDDITITEQSGVRAASSERAVTGSSMPVVGSGAPATSGQPGVPRAFAPSALTSGQCATPSYSGYGAASGGPVPMQGGPSYGAGVPRYDQPNMPNHAWPSYAAYPNYAAVTYPKQYSASAWPYIGPFYPYPQVPLGWRKVALEWDDGMWYLDYSSK